MLSKKDTNIDNIELNFFDVFQKEYAYFTSLKLGQLI